MKSTYSVSQAQAKLPSLVRSIEEAGTSYGISVHGVTSAYLVSRERMESLLETVEILGNPDAAQAIAAHKRGETVFHGLEALDA